MERSILTTIKKLLGLSEEYEQFDTDIIVYINTALAILTRIGLGPKTGFAISDKQTTWDELLHDYPTSFESVKTFIYIKVRLIFDPPATSYVIDSMNEMAKELEWTIYSEINYGEKEEPNE